MKDAEHCFIVTWKEPHDGGFKSKYKVNDGFESTCKFIKFLKNELKAKDIYAYEAFELYLEDLDL